MLISSRQIPFVQDFKQVTFYLSLFCLALLCLLSQPLQAASDDPLKKHSEIWQQLIAELPEDKGVFNRSLRTTVRERLDLVKLSNAEVFDEVFLKDKLLPRLEQLDKALSKYVHVSESQKTYQQLENLMPALINIEERKLIERLFKQQHIRLPNLRNSRLMPFLDRRVSQLSKKLIFNMKALVRERRPYEPELLKAMAAYGIEFSPRPPDFVLEYSLDTVGQNEKGEWLFDSHIALLGQYQMPVVTVNEVVVAEAPTEIEAQQKAVSILAKLVTMQLKEFLIQQALNSEE